MRSSQRQKPVVQDLGRVTRRWLAGASLSASFALASAVAPAPASAQMVGGEVTHGSAAVSQRATETGTHTQIDTATRHTRMKWERHDIPQGDSVRVQQPSSSSSYLAQVSDASVTTIDGILSSNGQVWIANPAGVYFGGSAVVDVARLVAGAGEISKLDFVNGRRRFTNIQGEVVNAGSITANLGVTLIGRAVANHGQIVTRRGDIVMAAGDEVWVKRHDTHIQVHMPDASGAPAVENTGVLETQARGRARLAAGDFLGLAIRNTGEIHSRTIALEAGADSIVEVRGTLDATRDESYRSDNRRGGTIDIEGDLILVDDAVIDASGPTGGGEIRIGGEVAGGALSGGPGTAENDNGNLRNARGTLVSDDSVIRADATDSGDGGSIVLWSDEQTQVLGTISAEGGAGGGAGGFIETSSKGALLVDADVSVAAQAGDAGLWLLDPVNVHINDAEAANPANANLLLTEAATPGLSIFDFLPDLDATSIPPDSYVSSISIEDALVRGGTVFVTTEARFLTLTGDPTAGDIIVESPINILPSHLVRPNTTGTLVLVAAQDVQINEEIASDNPNFRLNLDLIANDNELTSGAAGQMEESDQFAVGDVVFNADIRTNGGFVSARGVNVDLNAGFSIDTTRLELPADANGGFVRFSAANPVVGNNTPADVTIAGSIFTDGATLLATGQSFELADTGFIDAFGVLANNTGDEVVNLGTVDLGFLDDIVIDGNIQTEILDLAGATSGTGNLVFNSTDAALITISANQISLSAGDGVPNDPNDNDTDAQILIGAMVNFIDSGDDMAPTDPTKAPDEFRFLQDAAVLDADLPEVTQFGGSSVAGMRYGIESRDGAADPADFDIMLSSPEKFAGADLALVFPDSISIVSEIAPLNVSLSVVEGFTITTTLANNLRPVEDLVEEEGGILRVHAGLNGTGNLFFEDGVLLEAARISLQAGDTTSADNGSGTQSQVFATNTDDITVTFNPTKSMEIRQDALLNADNIPDADQFTLGIAEPVFPAIDYILQSEGGGITLADATKVFQTDLTLTARDTIELQQPISVNSMDLGGFASFQVTEDLLDAITIEARDALDPDYTRTFTLRAGNGGLSFQSQKQEDGQTIDLQLRVEAENIELIGQTIDISTGTPIFQLDDVTSPERFIFTQGNDIGDLALPTSANFADGLGPSELFVVQSTSSVDLSQTGQMTTTTDPSERFWQFPVQETTEVILTAIATNVRRRDGFNVVLGQYDNIWGDSVTLQATFERVAGQLEPIGFGEVDAKNVASILGRDPSIDYTEITLPLDPAVDGPMRPVPGDPDTEEPLPTRSFSIIQDADFLLKDPARNLLPDFGVTDMSLGVQPDGYSLRSVTGSIQVLNEQLRGTNLSLQVDQADQVGQSDTPDEFILFDRDGPLEVTSLFAQKRGSFEVGYEATVSGNPLNIIAERGISLVSDAFGDSANGDGTLSFADGVFLTAENFFLQAGVGGSGEGIYIDARQNDPTFNLVGDATFDFVQQGPIRNGVVRDGASSYDADLSDLQLEDIDYGRLPSQTQFDLTNGQLDRYRIASLQGDVEINDPGNVLIGRTTNLSAGSATLFRTLTLRADIAPADMTPPETCAVDAFCANGENTDPNLVLIPSGSNVEAVELAAATILLEAPEGYVDAGDPRIVFDVLGPEPRLAIRQLDAVLDIDAFRLPDRLQIVGGFDETPYELQAVGGITVGEELAGRVENSNLILIAGIPEDDFEAAFGATRGQPPVPDDDEDLPDHVYDRMSDLNGDGTVNTADRVLYDLLTPSQVTIQGSNFFELILRSLEIESSTEDDLAIRIGDVEIQTEADQTYRDEVQIIGDAILTARAGILDRLDALFTANASSIIFEEEVYGQTPGQDSLTVQATNRIRFGKNIGTHLDGFGTQLRLGSLSINLQQLIQLELPPPTPRAEFGSADLAGTFRVAADEVLLNASSGDSQSIYNRAVIPDAATFFRQGGNLHFDLGDGGVLQMGQNEKLSVDGLSLVIDAPNGTVTVGDLSALDLIDVNADTIHLLRRSGAKVVRANGRDTQDAGVDYVAKQILFHDEGMIHDSNTLHRNQQGQGRDARFGVDDPFNAPAFMDNFSVLSLEFNILTGEGLEFGGGDLPIDGIPDGISRVQLADTYPDIRPNVPIAVPANYRVQDPGSLRDVGIDVRLPTPSELRAAARGAATFRDLGSIERVAGKTVLDVSEVRLVAEEIERAVVLHDRVFAPDGSRAAQVRTILQAAADDYRRSTGARRIVGFELRRYVHNRPSSQFEAYQELQKLDSLFRHHRRSGLTPTEYHAIQREWLESILPEGISLQEFAEFIHPSRYVRGSDVLDVFGD